MWWPDRMQGRRRALAALAGGLVAGCGFQPLYLEQGGAASALRGQVAVTGADGRLGFMFRERLRDRLDTPRPDSSHTLDVALRFTDTGLAITRRDDITRFTINGEATWRLTRRGDGAVVADGLARSASGYSTLASPFATRAARLDAERRVAEDLAERVFARLAALPPEPPEASPPDAPAGAPA